LISKYYRLENIAKDLKLTIKSGRKTKCDLDNKVIKINPKNKLINKIYLLAHELGHAMSLSQCIDDWGLARVCHTKITREKLESELLAWYRADKLIKGIDLYNEDYLKLKHKCLKSYYLKY